MSKSANEPSNISSITVSPSDPPNSVSPSNPTTPSQVTVDHNNRLSRPGPARLVFYFTNGLAIFWALGFIRTRRLAAHQFLAENSHRLPTSDAGWYLYHRAKNYRVVWKGAKGGVKYSLAGGACAFLYGLVEEAWDQGVRNGTVDAGGSMVAGTATAGAYAMWKRMRIRQTLRCLRVGMGLGLISGLLQDLLRWSRGAPPWYLASLQEKMGKLNEQELENRKS
jgi:hypothetical protein